MPDKPQKTVFVLGAGASAASDFKLPVMKGFMAPLGDKETDYRELCGYLRNTYPKIEFSGMNLEDVFTHLELDIEGFASIRGLPAEELLPVRRQLLDYVHSVLCGSEGKSTPCRLHQKLLWPSLDEGLPETVITLNYDLVVDLSLYQAGRDSGRAYIWEMYRMLDPVSAIATPPGFLTEHRSMFLKLHGSVNWAFCPKRDCPNHSHFFPNLPDAEGPTTEAGDICRLCGTSLEWVLVPPTMRKSFEQFPKLGFIWRLAHEELKAADKVVFFGVSMAPSDYYLHWLIRSSLVYREPKPEVIVINPCKEAALRTALLAGVAPQHHYEAVEHYLNDRD